MSNRCLVLTDARWILPDRVVEHHDLWVEDGTIVDLVPTPRRRSRGTRVHSFDNALVSPGLVDLHVHGGGGADFMDGTPTAIAVACQTHLHHGTTTLFPTTTTGSPAQIQAMIAACRSHQQQQHQMAMQEAPLEPTSDAPSTTARIAGVHLYGPYFAPDKVGCHSPLGQRPPIAKEYQAYFKSGLVKIATCAAELPGALAFYRSASRHGCLVTCGHSNSTFREMQQAFAAGVRHVDHFWCAMSSVSSLRARCGTPMQASMEQFVLQEREMSTEVIADGYHLSDELLRFAYLFKGPDRLCLVSDASRALDQPSGQYRFGNAFDGSLFYSDGQVGWTQDRQGLASSVAGLDRMLKVMRRATGADWPELFRLATLTPATRAGIADQVGSLEVGKRADLVAWSPRLRVREVWIGGQAVSRLRSPRSPQRPPLGPT